MYRLAPIELLFKESGAQFMIPPKDHSAVKHIQELAAQA